MKRPRNIIILAALLIAAAVTAVIAMSINKEISSPDGATSQPGYNDIKAGELYTALANKDFFFVNVHVPYEGEIVQTDASIPYDQITDNQDILPRRKNAKIVLYCQTGRMSREAAADLTAAGYTNVYSLSGGMIEWEKQGYGIIIK